MKRHCENTRKSATFESRVLCIDEETDPKAHNVIASSSTAGLLRSLIITSFAKETSEERGDVTRAFEFEILLLSVIKELVVFVTLVISVDDVVVEAIVGVTR